MWGCFSSVSSQAQNSCQCSLASCYTLPVWHRPQGKAQWTALASSFLGLHHIPFLCSPCSWRCLPFLWTFPVLTTVLTKVSGYQKLSSFPVPPCLKSYSSQGSVVHLFLSYPLSALTSGQSVACWVCAGDCYAQPLHLQPQECERPSEKCQRQESVWKFLKVLIEKVFFSPSRSSNDQNSHHSYAKLKEEEQHNMWEHMLKVSWKLQLTESNHYVPPTQRLQPCYSLQADHSRCGRSSKT